MWKFFLIILSGISFSGFADVQLPWRSVFGDENYREKVSSIYTKANVSVSDGLTYQTVTSWLDPERSIFMRIYPDQQVTMGRAGKYFWSFDGQSEKEQASGIRSFVLGHQLHAQLLFFDLFEVRNKANIEDSQRCDCWVYTETDIENNQYQMHYAKKDNIPQFLITEYAEHGTVINRYQSWKEVSGVSLPMRIVITHEQREFVYQFTDITLNDASLHKSLLSPFDLLDDEQQLMRLHRDIIDAHLASDANLMAHIWDEEVTLVNRGEIATYSQYDVHKMMSASLDARIHTRYFDEVLPKISISEDASMALINAQVTAQGVRLSDEKAPQPFQFTSAWTAVFKKRNGHWRMTTNASNFKP